MERRHLSYFIAVVEAGSISEAARRMHLAQATVSHMIKELEREVRSPLFQRGREITLTPAGRALLGPARRALDGFEEARQAVAELGGTPTGRLDLAVAPVFETHPTVPLLARFRELHPQVRLRISSAEPGLEGFEALRRGEAELLVHGHPGPFPRYRSLRLPLAEYVLVFPPGAAEAPDGPIGLDELVRLELIVGGVRDDGLRSWLLAELAARELPPLRVAVETAHRDAVVPLVLAGVGAAVLAATEARVAEQLGAVVRPLAFELPRSCFLSHRAGHLSAAARAFVELAEEAGTPPD